MARQRNNVAGLHADLRRIVSRLLFDGATYDQVREEMASRTDVKIHNSSLRAWQRSDEYIRYRDCRTEFDTGIEEDRILASVINDGRGPESMTDVVIMDVVRAIRDKTRDGSDLDMAQLGSITKALAPILRNQVAEAKLEADTRLDKLKQQHADDIAGLEGAIADRDAMIADLKQALERKAGGVDPERRQEVIDAVNDFVRGPQQ